VAGLLPAAAVFIAWRRLAGALESPLPPAGLLVTALLLAVLAAIAHASASRRANILVSVAVLGIAGALAVPGVSLLVLIGYWTVIFSEECWAWRGLLQYRKKTGTGAATYAEPVPVFIRPGPPALAHEPFDAGSEVVEEEVAEPDADVLQQLTLRATRDGGQELSGWLRAALVPGQRTGSLHVAFCPAFDRAPQVQAEVVAGPKCSVKPVEVLPYGARLDFKLAASAAHDDSLLIWFFAESRPS
jgi:hypothetical protein